MIFPLWVIYQDSCNTVYKSERIVFEHLVGTPLQTCMLLSYLVLLLALPCPPVPSTEKS